MGNRVVYLGRHLMVKGEYVDAILKGEKVATVRLGIVKPKFKEIIIHGGGRVIGKAVITNVVHKRVKDLTDEDARKDGFSNKQELISHLKRHYPDLKFSDWVTIIEFKLVEKIEGVDDYSIYKGFSPVDIARIAIRYGIHKELEPEERGILKDLLQLKSIRKVALKRFGNLNKRWIVRRVVRKVFNILIERGIIKPEEQ